MDFAKLKPRMLKASWIILIGFILIAVMDFISTFSVGELVQYMESNPLYHLGGWIPVVAANLLALYILLMAYSHKKIWMRFYSLSAFAWLSVLRISVIINNFKLGSMVQAGAITEEMVRQVPTAAKIASYNWMVVISLFFPIFVTLMIFLFFSLDHSVMESKQMQKLIWRNL